MFLRKFKAFDKVQAAYEIFTANVSHSFENIRFTLV
jgi:hypothetical protein